MRDAPVLVGAREEPAPLGSTLVPTHPDVRAWRQVRPNHHPSESCALSASCIAVRRPRASLLIRGSLFRASRAADQWPPPLSPKMSPTARPMVHSAALSRTGFEPAARV